VNGDCQAFSIYRYATSFGAMGEVVKKLMDAIYQTQGRGSTLSRSRCHYLYIIIISACSFQYYGVVVHRYEPYRDRSCGVCPVKLLYQRFHSLLMSQFETDCHSLSCRWRCTVVHDTHPGFRGRDSCLPLVVKPRFSYRIANNYPTSRRVS
jgi:hypothetical protein